MKLFLRATGIISAIAMIISPLNKNINKNININFIKNKGDSMFDTTSVSVIESGFPKLDISDNIYNIYSEESEFPPYFDLRENGLIQNVKIQGSYGTCWTQTAVDSAETSLIKRIPDIDLSEWHLAYYPYTGGEQIDLGENSDTEELFMHGGSSLVAANIWSQWKGPVTEKEDIQYGNTDILTNKDLQDKYYNSADYHLKNAYLFDFNGDNPELREYTIKSFLIKGQAVDVSYYNSASYYDNTYNSYMSGQNESATHSVTIIGYDDNFPAENFTSKARPQNNGAWIAKNSWGNTWQDNGFFYISYEEPSLCEFSVFELEDADNYQKNYHHDTFISNQNMKAGFGNTSYMANIFQAEGDEWLQAVACNFVSPDTDYQIDIYTDLQKTSNPKSGKKVCSISGKNTLTGYQTIELGKNVTLSEGSLFSVVIKMTNSENPYVIPLESCLSVIDSQTGEILDLSNHTKYEQIKEYTHQNESLYSSDGLFWNDVTDSVYTYSEAEKQNLYKYLIDIYGENFVAEFEENFENSDVIIAKGNIPIKAFTNPINHVSFSRDSGFIYPEESIELFCNNSSEIYYSINDGEYINYTEPIIISEKCTIKATSDFETFSEKNYIPAYSTLNRLGYTLNKNENVEYIKPQKDGSYQINLSEYEEDIMLLPISQGEIKINDVLSESYCLTDSIPLEYGRNIISISVNNENAAPETIILNVNRGEPEILTGDVNNDNKIDAVDASIILSEYALTSAGESGNFSEIQKKAADFNNDNMVDSVDASAVLAYYAEISGGENENQ